MNIKFRKATEKDLPGFIALCNECFEENTTINKASKIFNKYKNDKNHIYVVGILDKQIVACAKITIIPTMFEHMATYAILNHICVKPEYRRHQIATKLLDYISKLCKQQKCKNMSLWSLNFRIPAHACYKNYGFEVLDAKFFNKSIKGEK